MKLNKIIIFTLYTLIIACIGFATVIEKYRDTLFVSEHIYGAWWFTALWAVLFTSLFKNETMYLYVSLGVVLVACVVTLTGNELPFLKSVQYLRWIFPIKYFLL